MRSNDYMALIIVLCAVGTLAGIMFFILEVFGVQ
jgi:hypothetical protein